MNTPPSSAMFTKSDAEISGAVPDATIYRERSRFCYLLQPVEPGDYELVTGLGYEYATALVEPVLVHVPDDHFP